MHIVLCVATTIFRQMCIIICVSVYIHGQSVRLNRDEYKYILLRIEAFVHIIIIITCIFIYVLLYVVGVHADDMKIHYEPFLIDRLIVTDHSELVVLHFGIFHP